MADSDIEWTDKTWNPVAGCARVSEGCRNCYAEVMAARHVLMSRAQGRESPYLPVVDAEKRRWNRTFITLPDRLADPLSWKKPRRVFVNSMSDLFGEGVPFEYIAAVFGVMAATPQHTYQVLTKRPARMVEFFEWASREHGDPPRAHGTMCVAQAWSLFQERGDVRGAGAVYDYWMCPRPWPLPNVWLGVSVEDQAAADERIPLLLQTPAAVRFLSCEPLLDWLDLGLLGTLPKTIAPQYTLTYERLDWIIVGGESGPGARRCEIGGIRSVIKQCAQAGVACFVKQVGSHPTLDGVARGQAPGTFIGDLLARIKDPKGGDPSEWPEDLRVRQWPRTEDAC